MSFMFRNRKEEDFAYSNEVQFESDELNKVKEHYDFLCDYIREKENTLKCLYAERKAALFTLKKFGYKGL